MGIKRLKALESDCGGCRLSGTILLFAEVFWSIVVSPEVLAPCSIF